MAVLVLDLDTRPISPAAAQVYGVKFSPEGAGRDEFLFPRADPSIEFCLKKGNLSLSTTGFFPQQRPFRKLYYSISVRERPIMSPGLKSKVGRAVIFEPLDLNTMSQTLPHYALINFNTHLTNHQLLLTLAIV